MCDHEILLEYIAANKECLKEMISEYTKHKLELLNKENPVFHKEIEVQYKLTVQELIVLELAKNTNINTETIKIFVENIDMEKYLCL